MVDVLLCVVLCLLFVDGFCLMIAVRCLMCVAGVAYCLWFVVCCALCVVRCLSFVVSCLLCDVGCLSCVGFLWLLFVVG